MNSIAELGFGQSADFYSRGRPSYPMDAVEFLMNKLSIGPETRVLELGAGTGKFTELIQSSGAQIVALEPVKEMRQVFQKLLPQIKIVDGTAESIPFADSTFDVVLVAQSFHWFQGTLATKEIHRVLRPSGALGLIWNSRDEKFPWVKKLTKILDRFERGAPRYRTGKWRESIDESTHFEPLSKKSFSYKHEQTFENFLNRILSISFISVLEPKEKATLINELRTMILNEVSSPLPELVELPYITDVYYTTVRKIEPQEKF